MIRETKKEVPEMTIIITIAILSVAAIAGALVVTVRDGYHRVPTRRY